MTNFFDNLVFITRNSSITLTELDNWSYFEFEMYMTKLNQQLEKENEEAKKRQKEQERQQNSMKAQMSRYLSKYNVKR